MRTYFLNSFRLFLIKRFTDNFVASQIYTGGTGMCLEMLNAHFFFVVMQLWFLISKYITESVHENLRAFDGTLKI